MAVTWKFYTDSGLTTELAGNLVIAQNQDGSTGDIDGVLYFGSTEVSKTLQADSNPGVDQISISITDSDPNPGTTPEATDLKLATSNGGLAGAVAGAALDLGVTLTSGVGNAVAVYYRQATPTAPVGNYTELGLTTTLLRIVTGKQF